MSPDIVNGIFELAGAILAWCNVYKLYEERIVKGVYWPVTAFFAAWGYWNLYFYSSLNQWCSYYAGAMLALANTVWVFMAWNYRSENLKEGYKESPCSYSSSDGDE